MVEDVEEDLGEVLVEEVEEEVQEEELEDLSGAEVVVQVEKQNLYKRQKKNKNSQIDIDRGQEIVVVFFLS